MRDAGKGWVSGGFLTGGVDLDTVRYRHAQSLSLGKLERLTVQPGRNPRSHSMCMAAMAAERALRTHFPAEKQLHSQAQVCRLLRSDTICMLPRFRGGFQK